MTIPLQQLIRLFLPLILLAMTVSSGCFGELTAVFGQEEKAGVHYSVVRTSAGGVHAYAPNTWGSLHVNMVNNRDVPREILCATYFQGDPSLQFARRVWLPARSMLNTAQPVLIPAMKSEQGRSLNFRTLVLDAESTGEVLVRDASGQMLHDGAILVTHQPGITGLIDDRLSDIENPSSDAYNLIVACRSHEGMSGQVAMPTELQLAFDEYSLHALNHLVLASSSLSDDAGAVASVRRWLFDGGHLWVMLDRTDPKILEMLIGDKFDGHVIDRVSLTTVQTSKIMPAGMPSKLESTDYEIPVDFVRVSVRGVETAVEVDGWPAAFWITCGDGRMLVSTLGARGWMAPRTATVTASPISRAGNAETPAVASNYHLRPTPPMASLATDLFSVRLPKLLSESSLSSQANDYIGYTIPERRLVIGVLFGLLAFLAGIGLYLNSRGSIEHMGWIGPVAALLVSVSLLMIGHSHRHRVSDTVASIEVVQPIPGTDDVRRSGVAAVYHREGSESPIRAIRGGRLMPDMTGNQGSVRRLVWTDFDQWSWQNLPQSAGQKNSVYTVSNIVIPRLEARATLTPEGFRGKILGGSTLTDGVLATRIGRIGVTFLNDGTFLARSEDVFGRDQFLAANLLGDEQDRRRRTLEKLLNNKHRRDFPEQPLLLGWTDRSQIDFDFGGEMNSRGSKLIAIPLVLDRPTDSREFLIPSPWLPYRNASSPDGLPPTGMWNYKLKEWQERSEPTSNWLRFQVPSELLPVTATRARIVVQVAGPVGRLELLGLRNKAAHSLKALKDPVGRIEMEVTDPQSLVVSDDGGLVLGISAGDPGRPELTHTQGDRDSKVNYWKIESLDLQLWVTPTTPAPEER